jgi:dTDP-4-amino-4,6-dideoxygalactose transaminase
VEFHKVLNLDNEPIREAFATILQSVYLPSCTHALCLLSDYLRALCGPKPIIARQRFTDQSQVFAFSTRFSNIIPMEISKRTWNVTQDEIDSIIDMRPQALIITDTFGSIACKTPRITTIFDGAHTIGLPYREGCLATVLSFAPSKIVTGGEGGAILTNDAGLVNYCRDRAQFGRPSEFSAVILNWQLDVLASILDDRKRVAEEYIDALGKDFQFQEIDFATNWSRVGMLVKSESVRKKITDSLNTRKYYVPLTPTEPVRGRVNDTDLVYERMVVLPNYDGLDTGEIIRTVRAV